MILQLFKHFQAGMPPGLKVLVLADRGIGTSPELMRGIMALGWTFLLRVTRQSKIMLADESEVTFYDQGEAPGQSYAANGMGLQAARADPGACTGLVGRTGPRAMVAGDQ